MAKRVVCTVITKSFLAHARTLAESLTEHNPDVELYVLLADRIDNYFDPSLEPFHLIQLEDLPEFDVVSQMCFYYTPFELCCALRGYLHEYIFRHTSAESWIFLDADIMIFHSLDKIFEQVEEASIVLTPHLQSLSMPVIEADLEIAILNAGLYNAGFVGLKRTAEALKFITWFKERLQDYCFNDVAVENTRGLFVDQRWLNLAPLYFKDVALLLDAGANLGHWNLFDRTLKLTQDHRITVNQQPLFFVHFSGWDIANPDRISKYSVRYDNADILVWKHISIPYRERLLKNGYETTIQYPCAFDSFETGEPISRTMRRLYYDNVTKGMVQPESPFADPAYFHEQPYIPSESKVLLREKVVRSQEYINELNEELSSTQASFAETQAELALVKGVLPQTQVELLQAQTELTHLETRLVQTQAKLTQTQSELAQAQIELEQFQTMLEEIKQSKLWAIREIWNRFKQIVGFSGNG
ncbi:glycosyl transferase, group 1 [Myxacorys almedinensis]|uniref:Glycosyl transferase, group 1 n=1 Tax=Myxacorys almedinensis A TaxID=2690445 RepID=A0A8J7Z184_9CYAN|nr:glycosyl transferase, group 1 [Myxacorys almedinensis]NDJ16283.1 glycosyl transferase, group 1 [Myxacorys almedinensis A]